MLLWSERLSRLSPIVIGLYLGLLTLLVAIVWATVNDSIATGAIVGIAFLFFVALDWLMLAALPWRKRSYGPVAPGLMAFTTARSIITIIAALALCAASLAANAAAANCQLWPPLIVNSC